MRARKLLTIASITVLSIGLTAGISYWMLRATGSKTPAAPASAHGHGPGQGQGKDDHKGGETKVKLSDAQVAGASIEIHSADAGKIQETLRLNGMTQTNQEAVVQVTPRFPDGLSVLDVYGQWKSARTGAIARERSKRLSIIVPDATTSAANVEAIKAAYRQRFRQESVLQSEAMVCAAF